MNNATTRGILIGAVAGALLGAAIGWAYASGVEEGKNPGLAPGDYFRLGIALLGVARQVGELAERA